MNHALHGKRSEKLTEDERQLAFEDLSIALAEVEVQKEHLAVKAGDRTATKPAPKRTIGNLPVALPRIEEVTEPDSLICPCGCGIVHKIGEDREPSGWTSFPPSCASSAARQRMFTCARGVTIRPKYACRICTDGVTQAPAPSHLIMGGLPTEAIIAHVPPLGRFGSAKSPAGQRVSKYADHLPLYRQSQILARAGLDPLAGRACSHAREAAPCRAGRLGRQGRVPPQAGCRPVGGAPETVRQTVHALSADCLAIACRVTDETTAPVLDPGRGKTKTGYLWALARDDRASHRRCASGATGSEDPPGVVYFYAQGRAGENAETFLTGFDGILQIDGYTGYNRLTKPIRKGGAPIQVAHCWAYARRKLKEVFDRDGSEIAAEGLRRIAEFYAVEADIRGVSPGQRLSARQTRTAPLVAAFGEWLQAQRRKISAKSRLGEKLAYIHNHWDGLQTFLTDGRVEIDSNRVENLIRPIALNRKNALFAPSRILALPKPCRATGHDEGGIA